MPYFRQKTWLPLAPRIAGLSVKESPYGFGVGSISWGTRAGLGQAICTDNNGDIVDCITGQITSPATGSGLPLTTASNAANYGSSSISLLPSNLATGGGTTGTSLSTWLQQNESVIVVLGIGLFAVALIKGMK
jgi:hypothetical protein